MRGFVAVYFVTLRASVKNDIPLFWIGNYLDGLHRRATLTSAVTGIYVNVKRPKAKRAVIARGVAEGQYLTSTVRTDKSVVVF